MECICMTRLAEIPELSTSTFRSENRDSLAVIHKIALFTEARWEQLGTKLMEKVSTKGLS